MSESVTPGVDGDETRLTRLVALKAEARQRVEAGQFDRAIAVLRAAIMLDGNDPALWLNLAGLQRACGEHRAAATSVEQALVIEPKSMLGLLMKGSLLERAGDHRAAAVQYGRAVAQRIPGAPLDAATEAALQRADDVHRRYLDDMAQHVRAEIGARQSAARTVEARRVELFIDATLGTRRIFPQQPTDYCYPGLPAIEFHDRDEFPWLPALEAQTDVIRDELRAIVASADNDRFAPYVAYADGIPLDQWAELNRSPRWSAFHLFERGQVVEHNAARCPKTLSMLRQLPQPQAAGRMPAAMFSLLRPQTRIPPHTGVANVRLVVHLPLIVPPGCGFRVGNETRIWREGEAWVFDDTIEHEAWNDSDRDRYVLIFDVWNPHLSIAERELITAVMAAMDRYNGIVADGSL